MRRESGGFAPETRRRRATLATPARHCRALPAPAARRRCAAEAPARRHSSHGKGAGARHRCAGARAGAAPASGAKGSARRRRCSASTWSQLRSKGVPASRARSRCAAERDMPAALAARATLPLSNSAARKMRWRAGVQWPRDGVAGGADGGPATGGRLRESGAAGCGHARASRGVGVSIAAAEQLRSYNGRGVGRFWPGVWPGGILLRGGCRCSIGSQRLR
jgi:hypothetical protein